MLTRCILETSVRAVGGGIWSRPARLFDRRGGSGRSAADPAPEGELRGYVRSLRRDRLHDRADRLLGVAASRRHRTYDPRGDLSPLGLKWSPHPALRATFPGERGSDLSI